MQYTNILAAAVAGSLLLGATQGAQADDKALIDANTERALTWLRSSDDTAQLLDRAAGVLVFPDIVEMGFGVGGEFGEGSLLVKGETIDYYATAGTTFGMSADAAYKAKVIFFMTEEALQSFRTQRSLKLGEQVPVPVAATGFHALETGAAYVGMIFSEDGPVTHLGLDGDRITRIVR